MACPDIQALDLASFAIQVSHCDAPSQLQADSGNQQATARRTIDAREACNFSGKVLKAKIDVERPGVFFDQRFRVFIVNGAARLANIDFAYMFTGLEQTPFFGWRMV